MIDFRHLSGLRHAAPVAVCVLAGCLVALPARGETLLQVYELAHQSDPRYRAAQAEARANATAIDQARAGFLPTLKFDFDRTLSRQKIIESQNPIFGAGTTNYPTNNTTLSLTQTVFRKETIVRFEQAKAVVRQSEFTVLAAEQELQFRTTAAYLAVLAATDSVALAQAERVAVGKLLDLARERLKMGLGTITSQYDAEARFAVARAREVEANNKLRDARQGLREIAGKPVEDTRTLGDDFPLELPAPASIEQWVDAAMAQNIGLRAKQAAVDVAHQEIRRREAGHYPTVGVALSHNRRDAGSTLFGGGSKVETIDLVLRLSVPLYEGGLVDAATREAVERHVKSQEDLEQERRAVDRATRASFEGAQSAVSLVQALRQSVAAQQNALEAKEEGFRAGLFGLLPVLDAQRDLYLARRDFEQSRYDYLLNRLRLKLAAGTLSEVDLAGIDAVLR